METMLRIARDPCPAIRQLLLETRTPGELIGLATLAVYGFGIQDAANGANDYNRRNNLSLTFQINPRSGAQLALRF